MKKIGNYIAFVFLFLSSFAAYAADFNAQVKTSVDRNQLGIGDSFTLSILVQANDDFDDVVIKLPTLTGLELLNSWSDGKSSSTRMSIVNGKSDFTKSVAQSFNFMLSPQKEGQFIIPVIDVPINGKTFKTQPITISVDEKFRGQAQKQQQQPRARSRGGGAQLPPGFDDQNDPFADENDIFTQLLKEKERIFDQMRRGGGGGLGGGARQQVESKTIPDLNTNEAFFVYLDLDQKEVYEGQQITANWYIYVKGQIESLDRAKFPDLKGFWKEIVEEVPSLQFIPEIVNGVNYQKALLASHALFPIKAGTAIIDEFRIKARTRMPTQFGWGESHEWTKNSKRVAIKVLPLPNEGKPRNFSGAVGSFEVSIKTDGTQFPAHQPFSVKIRFEGTGNAKLIDLPNIQWPEGLEVFDTKSEAKFFKNGQSYKEFEVLLIPRKEGDITIPAIDFSHFDPQQKKYISKMTEPLKLTITKALPGANATSGTTGADIATPAGGKSVAFQPQAQLEIPEASLITPQFRYGIYLVAFALSLVAMLVYFFKQFKMLNQDPQLNLMIAQKMKLLTKNLSENNYRQVGAEGVNLIYTLAAYLSGQRTANQEWSSVTDRIPFKLKEKFLARMSSSFDYFQLLGFAPDAVQKNIVESKTTNAELEKLRKLAAEIDADLKASDNN
ncbi:MAG: protein BatD [Bdellovibrio sp.]|nr:protein BatD [Bdellovibrio sp.]